LLPPASRCGIKGRKGIKGRNDFGTPLNRPRLALQVSRAKLGMSWSPISSSLKGSFRTFCLLPGLSRDSVLVADLAATFGGFSL
jgi:hypothetical protein